MDESPSSTMDSDDSLMKKVLILASLKNDLFEASIDESMLEKFEILETLCNSSSSSSISSDPITHAFKAAYCAVLVECTVKYLDAGITNPNYSKAVHRIWMSRGHGSALFTDEVKQWKRDIVNSLLVPQLRNKFASMPNTRRDAIQKVQLFLSEAFGNAVNSSLIDSHINQHPQKESLIDNRKDPKDDEMLNETLKGKSLAITIFDEELHRSTFPSKANITATPTTHGVTCLELHPSTFPRKANIDKCSTATHEETTSNGTSYDTVRCSLPSPKRVRISPLKKYEEKKIIRKRRRAKKWSQEEEYNLRDGVNKFGQGMWKEIRNAYTFDGRTEVDLKDKWRNILSKGY